MLKNIVAFIGVLAVISGLGTVTASAATASDTSVVTVANEQTTGLTSAQRNAIAKAQSYLRYTAFSRKGLIDQLKYERFSTRVATFAVDYLRVSWNIQAFKKAKSYLSYTSFSLPGLIDQLRYEGFTLAQATYGAKRAY